MRKWFLILFITSMGTSNFFISNDTDDTELLASQNLIEHERERITPTGLWFTEDNELP